MEFNLQTIIDLVNGVGFPIAMCIALFWLNNFTLKAQQQSLLELKSSIQDNTNATNNLVEVIKRG